MKNDSRAIGWFLSTILVGGILLLGSIHSVSAQALCGSGPAACRSSQPQSFIFKSEDNEFELGRKVAVCLMNNCTILVGNITNVKFDPDSPIVKVHFHVTERLDGY